MKNLIISSLILCFSQIATANEITDWDGALPQAQSQVINQLQTYAKENFSYDHWQGSCGGETADYALENYYTHESYDGELIHKVLITLYVTQSYMHCEDVVISECNVPVTIYSDDHVSLGRWSCTVIETP